MKKYVVRWDSQNGNTYPEGRVEQEIAKFLENGGEWVVGQPVLIVALQAAIHAGIISPDDITFIGDDEEEYPIDTDGMFEQIYPNSYSDLTVKYLMQMF